MRSVHTTRLSLTLILFCLGSAPTLACSASDQLSALGRAYKSLLATETPADWRAESTRLAQSLKSTDATDLGRNLGVEGAPADISRVARLFADVSSLATGTWNDRADHTQRSLENLAYIDRMLQATGCEDSQISIAQPGASDTSPTETIGTTPPKPSNGNAITALTWTFASLALVLMILAASAYVLTYWGRPQRKTDRLTRYPTVIPVLVISEDAPPELIDTADVSRGGVRLSWVNAPPEGTAVTIDFSELECPARIIWSNAYFAGVRFDSLLSDDDLTRIRNRNNNP